MAKYDDASWHFGGEFPPDLSEDKASTHIGMFMGWVMDTHLEGQILMEEFAKEIASFRNREITGTEFLRACCDNKLTDDDLNDEGVDFAEDYYEPGIYFDDYEKILGEDTPTLYHVEDTWENYVLLKNQLDLRFNEWKNTAFTRG